MRMLKKQKTKNQYNNLSGSHIILDSKLVITVGNKKALSILSLEKKKSLVRIF
jgi:hypothetical protein